MPFFEIKNFFLVSILVNKVFKLQDAVNKLEQ